MILRTSIRSTVKPYELDAACKEAERVLAVQVERDSRPFIPASSERLRSSGRVQNNWIIWDTPYAAVQYFGNVYVDPKTKAGGFLTEDGWKSRAGVAKIRSDRKYLHNSGGDKWVYRAREANRAKWLAIAQREINRGK